MIVRRYAELDQIETPGQNTSGGIATPRYGAAEVSVIRQRELPGGHNPAHTHDHEEVIVLLAGSITLTAGEEPVTLAAGDAAIVPAHTQHQIRNTSGEPAEWLLIAPGGTRFFHASGEQAHPEWAQ